LTHPCRMFAADANSLKGKGTESSKAYKNCKILFQNIANIHTMRDSLAKLRNLVLKTDTQDKQWPTQLASTGWLQHVSAVISASSRTAYYVRCRKTPVVVHCSDGWDRTAQVRCVVPPAAVFPVICHLLDSLMRLWIASVECADACFP
jgi:hypothetical protein